MNLTIFLALNAGSSPSPAAVALALFFSKYVPYCLMAYCAVAFLFGGKELRFTLLITLVAASVAAAVSWLIGHYAYVPRPFVEAVGHALLTHKDNASFPSNHTMFMVIFATTFLMDKQRKIGLLFSILALCIGWSRVFLGLHYPADIVGAVVIGMIVSLLVWMLLRPRTPHSAR
ncbi:phosphatase PAP2 family protein [Paenalcaligenes niemegkensis]|uniref:phosphatase PAP2 family protein n=1 Tax=Paenalcaligenes niemegkensis TaxID=2895469 RepID=UPI001EE793FA|nr:phosphatase PAP2 family protein [Paenalcaligenes niemegkensis]MCQ9616497.1 phosphatase PAP2 family protein [Paenalcaligenes niemegkensis]